MAPDSSNFYKGSEGFLGEPMESKLLFLMRESNCGKNLTVRQDEFWFKSVVEGDKQDKVYLSKLGQIASLLAFGKPATNDEERRIALKQAIYINMNPVSGKGTKSPEYIKALANFRYSGISTTNDSCSVKVELNSGEERICEYPNRWNIILSMPDGSCIVTVGDIFTAMFSRLEETKMILSRMENKTLHITTRKVRRTMRTFRFVYMNKTITVLETLHPKARADQFFQWNDISLE